MPNLNASLHLQSLGWAGPGHPLNPNAYKQKGSRGLAYDAASSGSANTNNNSAYFAAGGNGLIRPLLVSKKEGNLGLGRRAHEPQKGNEWWLKGFEAALKKDHTATASNSRDGSGASTPRGGAGADELQRSVNVQAGRFGGLYGFFVKGETVGGTIGVEEDEVDRVGKKGRKRKSDVLDESDGGGSREVDTGKRRKKNKRGNGVGGEDAQQDFGQVAAFMTVRDKSERKKAKERRKLRESEQFRVAGEWLGLKEGRNGERDSRKMGAVSEGSGSDDCNGGAVKEPSRSKDSKKRRIITDSNGITREETKEERRVRRAVKKERKAKERTVGRNGKAKSIAVTRLLDSATATPTTTATTTATTSAATSDNDEDGDETDDKAATRRRKEERRERRRRKGQAA